MTRDELYHDLAGAIVDGAPIDWAAAESSDGDDDRGLVARLKLIASVATLHRRLPQVDATVAPADVDTSWRWGHLAVLERIGSGAFGEVYRAWDARLDREVALKLMPARTPLAGDQDAAIIEEGRALARVRHPNVVTLYGAEVIDHRVGLWMELIEGETLDQLVKGGKRWSAREIATVGLELCRAVSAVHAAGLLHRDIKASNVMTTDDGRVVLMDFGTGRVVADGAAMAPAGTPIYLAPEVLVGSDPSAASDVYSIGVVLFYLLTGSYPVVAADVNDLRRAHERGDRASLEAARPDLPPKLMRVIDRALDRDPERRYSTADALAADLGGLAGAGARRVGWRAVSLGIAAMLLLTAGAAWLLRGTGSPDPSQPNPRSTRRGQVALGSLDSGSATLPTVVVLPFDTLADQGGLIVAAGTAPNSDYFAEGIADEIIRDLGRVDGLAVRSRYSSFAVGKSPRNLREIGERLDANLIVTGSVLRSGDQLRISAQLVDTARDVPLWSKRFDRKLASSSDILAIVDEIAHAIVNELRLTLGGAHRRYDTDVETYDLYLRAHELGDRFRPADLEQAAAWFEQVTERDPQFAPGFAGLAGVYHTMSLVTGLVDRDVALGVMRPAAERAIELDPLLAEAHAASGVVHALEFEWQAAGTSFRRALDLDPTLTETYTQYAVSTLLPLGLTDDAVRLLRRALEQDPLSVHLQWTLAFIELSSGRYDDAIATLEPIYATDPDFPLTRVLLARSYTFAGRLEEAFAMFDELERLGRDMPHFETHALIRAGRRAEVEEMAADCQDPYLAVIMWAALEDAQRTLAALEVEAREEPQQVPYLLVCPELQMFRGDARFGPLRKRFRLPNV